MFFTGLAKSALLWEENEAVRHSFESFPFTPSIEMIRKLKHVLQPTPEFKTIEHGNLHGAQIMHLHFMIYGAWHAYYVPKVASPTEFQVYH